MNDPILTKRARGLRRPIVAVAVVAAVVALAAGCGGDDDDSSANSSDSSKTSTSSNASAAGSGQSSGATVKSASTDLGTILVDSNGRTLYLFEKDKSDQSECSGACATAWPPSTSNGDPVAGSGVQASMLGTTTRSDGKTQVTYNGHPVYTFTGDSKAGDVNGEGVNAFGALWYVVAPAGDAVTGSASGSGSGSSGSGSSGSGSSGLGY